MPPLPLSLTVAYLSSRMENDDEFASFPHISRFSERAKLAQCRGHSPFMYTWFSFPHHYAPPSLRYTIGQMRTCACWPSALCTWTDGFLARASPRPSNRKKSEIENPEDTNYDKSPLSLFCTSGKERSYSITHRHSPLSFNPLTQPPV